jgi:hypothetical protein
MPKLVLDTEVVECPARLLAVMGDGEDVEVGAFQEVPPVRAKPGN